MTAWDIHPYSAEGYLYILKPDVIFSARINMASATYPLHEIIYDAADGNWSDVKMGQTLLLGSSPGLWDLGRVYVRAAHNDVDSVGNGTSTINVAYCSRGHNIGELSVIDNAHITILDLYEEWKRPVRMDEDGVVSKDYDWGIPGNTQPVAHVGASKGLGMMDFIDQDTGTLKVTSFDASSSYRTDATGVAGPITPIWSMADGNFVDGTIYSDFSPHVTFAPGKRWVQVEAIAFDVASASLPRRYLVVALDGEDDPELVQRVSRVSWSIKPEGITLQATVTQRLNPADYLPGTVVLLMLKETRAGEVGSQSGYEMKFAGWLEKTTSSVTGSADDTEVVTTIVAIDDATRLGKLKALPTTIQSESAIITSNTLVAANIDRYWWWYIYWHTFAACLTDVQWSQTGSFWPFMTFSSPGGSFYTVLDNLARAIGFRTTAGLLGNVQMNLDPMRLPKADRTYPIVQAIGVDDVTRVERTKNPFPTVGLIRCTATVISSGHASDVLTPFPDIYAVAPGNVEGQGISEQQNAYPWLVQSATDQQARLGEDYGRANTHEGWLRVTLAHGGDIGLKPLDWVSLTLDTDTVGWTDDVLVDEPCLVQAIDFTFDDESGTLSQVLTVERESVGSPASNDPIALGKTPCVQVQDFQDNDGGFTVAVPFGTWKSGQGWTCDATGQASISLLFAADKKITALTVQYHKADNYPQFAVTISTLASGGGGTHESFQKLDSNLAGDYTFTHTFDGTPVSGIDFLIGYGGGDIDSAITGFTMNFTTDEGCL